jgi:prepilin-type N-terminal cleavage/methylation domain-containing protein
MKILVNKKKVKNLALDGFSLIEMAMVLLVIGIIAGSVFKGREVIETAQIRSVITDIETIRMAYTNYSSAYGPVTEPTKFFQNLHESGLISSPEFKLPKIGGKYSVVLESNSLKLKISASDGNTGILNKKQVLQMKAKIAESLGADVFETDPGEIKEDTKYVVKIIINQ